MEALLPSRPETYRQLIRRSLKLYRASFSHIVLLTFLLSIIVFIPRLLSDLVGQDLFGSLHPFSPHRLWLVLINLASMLFFIAIIWRMHCVIRNVHEPLIQDFRIGLNKVVYVFVATIIISAVLFAITMLIFGFEILLHHYDLLFSQHPFGLILTLIVFVGQMLLILYVFTLFFFFIPLIAIENKGIFSSLESSILLVWNHWWRVFSSQMTPWVCYLALIFIMRTVLDIDLHIYFTESMPHSIWTTILNLVLFALFIPWVAALLLVQLKDLELRRKSSRKKHGKK